MSLLERIDSKNFVIKYNETFSGSVSYNHLFCDWSLICTDAYEGKFKAFLKCAANNSNLWKINAEVTFKFIKSDGTEGCKETVNAVYQHDNSEICNVTALVRSDYVNENKYAVDCYVKIKSIIGFPYKMHDFTRSDDIINNTALIVEGKKLYVSKQALAMTSPVFHSMFYSKFKESTDEEIPIEEVKYEEFEEFLQLIYGCSVHINIKNVDSLLQLADRFDVPDVMKKCEDYLMSMVSTTNYYVIPKLCLIASEKYSLSRLQDKTLNELDKHTLKRLCSNNTEFGEATLRALVEKAASMIP